MTRKECDVLIVGSGAAGGMAAHTLTAKGASCLMLEAGPLPDFDRKTAIRNAYELPYRGLGNPQRLQRVVQADEFNANRWVDEQEVPYTYPPENPYYWVRVRMVGGKSLFWARMSFRLSDYEFKAADLDGFGANWPIEYADLAPFYDRVEPLFRVSGQKEGLEQLPDGIFVPDESAFSEPIEKFRTAAAKHDTPVTKIRRSQGDGRMASSFNITLPRALATGKLDLVENAVARAVTVDKTTGLANGVLYVDRRSGREMHARAKRVVLAASALESIRILLNSDVANSSGTLGRYIMDQFYVKGSVIAIDPTSRRGRRGSGYIPRVQNLKGQKPKKDYLRGYAVDFHGGSTPDPNRLPSYGKKLAEELASYSGQALSFTTMGDVLPRYENNARIDDTVVDKWGIPVLRLDVSYTENEFAMARDAMHELSQLSEDAGFRVINAHPEMGPPGESIHELGGCRMGDDPKTSVLNQWNQCHDVKNLYVVDGSSFVTAGSQNPTITIMALTMRACERMVEEAKKGNV
ncbi:MAG: GMC family oxidoreductase [Bryobacterales bacterium]|nr:GMC family oxidoreductase [Bryobacterales bacterium]